MSNDIQIVALPRQAREVLRFLKVAYGIYRENPHWVAPLLMDLKKVFMDANPLFQHAEMQLWVATRRGRDVGRIASILDHHYNQAQPERTAFFGFFESVDDHEVSRLLFDQALSWARQKGVQRLVGPMNPTGNDECGLLVEGFDSPPAFMMPYNLCYYPALVEAAGYRKTKDLLAFHLDLARIPLNRLGRIAGKVKHRWPNLTFRPLRRRTLARDLARIKEVYNAAWEENWGFVPMTAAEVDFLAARLKPLMMEGLVWLAEAGDEPVAFLLAVPDYNAALQPLRGRLLTPQVFGFLPYLLRWKYPPRSRVIALGVKKGYRGKGLESVMLFEGLKAGFDGGFREAEASWILEDNTMMCRVLETFGGKPSKVYRLYEREV